MEFTFSLLQCLLPRLAQFASRRASAPMLSPSVFLSLQEILRGVLFWSTLHLWVTDIQRTPRRRLSKGARQLTSDSPVHKTMARLACHQKRLCLPSINGVLPAASLVAPRPPRIGFCRRPCCLRRRRHTRCVEAMRARPSQRSGDHGGSQRWNSLDGQTAFG